MKKLIGMVIASLVFCNIGFAEVRKIEESRIRLGNTYSAVVQTRCVDGYKFVIVRAKTLQSVVQFFERVDGVSLPVKC